ncbi:MAG: TVP38/TMEM64 family protein [Deltaproteobacteria bacterium HGW-Deltaproteobacteria-10]|nr:MAG: TVP38/TMEM64 family protein [Deltaproteobacteria bacterium HGW-Deltaproteobacteria-10]
MKPVHKKILIALIIAAAIVSIRLFGLDHLLSLETFRQYRDQLQAFTAQHYLPTVAIFILIYIAAVALSIPGATILTLTAGFLFGFFGVIYVNIGASAGAILAFLAARYLIGDWVQKRYGEKLASFNKEIAENGYNYLLTLRFIPLFPFFLINIFAGLTRVPLTIFAWTTIIGILPGSFVYIYTGRQLGVIDKPGDILSWQIILAFVLLGLLVLSPVVIKKFMKQKRSNSTNVPEED